MINSLVENWKSVCDESQISTVDKKLFGSNQFFNRYAFENLDDDCKHLEKIASKFKKL